MSRDQFRGRIVLTGGLIVVTLLILAQAGVRGAGSSPTATVVVQDEPPGPLHLGVTFVGDVLIGTVTVADKDSRPWMGVRGQASLLDSTGRQLARVPLQPLGPGEFRLVFPLHQLDAPGYLDVRLPGGQGGECRGTYQVDRDRRTVTWAKVAPDVGVLLAPQASGGPDDFGYTWDDSAVYNWIDTTGGTSVVLRDDDRGGPFPIGFTFSFYGQSYTQFYLDSNGYIGFDISQTASYYYNSRLPLESRPNNLVAPFWDDFDPSHGGTVRYRTFGTPPSRYLVVEWNSVPLWGTSDAQTFQLILYQNSNNIKFQYAAARSGTGGDLRYGTAGIEDADGTIGLEYLALIPIGTTRAVQFSYAQAPYNVFLTPERQGSSAGTGETASFSLTVRNLGANSDSFVLDRPMYDGSNWLAFFYEANGTTPLPGNSTGSIATGAEKQIVARVQVPGSATIGDWTRATVRATSYNNPGEAHAVTLDAVVAGSFAQVYTDDESGDGTEDSENYFHAFQEGHPFSKRVTTDQDNSAYAAVATTPDDNAVNVWNTNYYNGTVWVSDIQYAVLNRAGSFVRSVTLLTNNSAATQKTSDFSPAADVALNGNMAIGWARQVDANGDGALDRYNAWYAVVSSSSSGSVIKAPGALTNNTGDYPRDYPPSVAALASDRFLLAWEHGASSGGPVDIYYAVVNNNGTVNRVATRLTDGTGQNYAPRVAGLPNGQAAVVWMALNTYGHCEIRYATLDSGGTVIGGPVQVTSNDDGGAESTYADVVALSDNRVGIAWTQTSGGSEQIQYAILPGLASPIPTSTSTPTPTPTPTSTPTNTPTPTSTPSTPTPGGIRGRVTYQGSPTAGINLALRFFNGSTWSTALTTATQADGTYAFTGAPSLTAGQVYYVRYNNGSDGNADNPAFLAAWYGPQITSYTSGNQANGGDFDIANIPLISPTAGVTVTLPAAFTWTQRSIITDSYRLMLYYPAGDNTGSTNLLGYLDRFTITGLPVGWPSGGQYYWWVEAHHGDGTEDYGVSYWSRRIVIQYSAGGMGTDADERISQSPPDPDWLADAPLTKTWATAVVQRTENALPKPPIAPAITAQAIYTVPNAISDANIYVSLTTDQDDNLIMTWLDNNRAHYLFYALADQNGTIRTPATILQRTRRSYLWSSWNGYGNDPLRPGTPITDHNDVYLPTILRNYPPTPLPPVVANGGFEENGLAHWTAHGDVSGLAPRAVTSRLHSGSYAALLGQEGAPCGNGGLIGQSWIYQDIEVPASGVPQLSLYYRVFTHDKLNADKFDRFEVYIHGTLLRRFGNTDMTYGCLNPKDSGWQQFTYDLSPYRGQTIRLRLVNVTHPDGQLGTWTYVDDIQVSR